MEEDGTTLAQGDQDACGKLWAIYVDEARQYDEGLIQSWKDDMDVTLVFSGLYSAVLTAFVIESYHSLQADPAEATTVLLKRISEQLGSQPSLTPVPDDALFTPSPAALACNILWFISLALALGSSFLATIIQQWARRFLHRTSVVRSGGARARLIQFLYFGIKDLGMHTVVEVIPSFLHLSLCTFFAGLIAFLWDVNGVLRWLFTAVLIIALGIYWTFSILPVVNLSSPYATPLSPLLWRIWRFLKTSHYHTLAFFKRARLSRSKPQNTDKPPILDPEAQLEPSDSECSEKALQSIQSEAPSETIQARGLTDAMIKASQARRDHQESACVLWTFKAVNEDRELLDFIEALGESLQDGYTIRERNLHLIKPLLNTSDTHANIIARTLDVMKNAQNPWYDEVYRNRCAITCSRFLYIISWVLAEHRGDLLPLAKLESIELDRTSWSPEDIINMLEQMPDCPETPTARSAIALCSLSICQKFREILLEFHEDSVPVTFLRQLTEYFQPWDVAEYLNLQRGDVPSSFNRSDAQTCIDGVLSVVIHDYLEKAIEGHPPEFDVVCQLLRKNGADPHRSITWNLSIPYEKLGRALEANSVASTRSLDAIFSVIFDSAVEKDRDWILLYISKRVESTTWGNTREIWTQDGRVLRLCKILKNVPLPASLDDTWIYSLQELLFHARWLDDDAVWAFFAEVVREKPGSYISFLILLAGSMKKRSSLPSIQRILSYRTESLASDPYLSSVEVQSDSYIAHWRLILQCLNTKTLKSSQTRNILQYLFTWPPLYTSKPHLDSSPIFIKKFVEKTVELSTLFADYPSMDHLDINAMVWSVWASYIPLADHDVGGDMSADPDTLASWSELIPLLQTSGELLTPTARQKVQRVITDASDRQRFTIALPENSFESLTRNVEKFQRWILKILPLVVRLPPPSEDERLQL